MGIFFVIKDKKERIFISTRKIKECF